MLSAFYGHVTLPATARNSLCRLNKRPAAIINGIVDIGTVKRDQIDHWGESDRFGANNIVFQRCISLS